MKTAFHIYLHAEQKSIQKKIEDILHRHVEINSFSILLTKREGRAGEYWPQVVTVRSPWAKLFPSMV